MMRASQFFVVFLVAIAVAAPVTTVMTEPDEITTSSVMVLEPRKRCGFGRFQITAGNGEIKCVGWKRNVEPTAAAEANNISAVPASMIEVAISGPVPTLYEGPGIGREKAKYDLEDFLFTRIDADVGLNSISIHPAVIPTGAHIAPHTLKSASSAVSTTAPSARPSYVMSALPITPSATSAPGSLRILNIVLVDEDAQHAFDGANVSNSTTDVERADELKDLTLSDEGKEMIIEVAKGRIAGMTENMVDATRMVLRRIVLRHIDHEDKTGEVTE